MLIADQGQAPKVDPSAWVAPNAVLCGDVTLGPGTRIAYGAQVIAEAGGSIALGASCIVMENAVIRASARHPVKVGDHCLIGPSAHVAGATLEDQVFVAAGAPEPQGCRSAWSRSATRPRSCRPIATTRSGPCKSRSTSRARSTASRAARKI